MRKLVQLKIEHIAGVDRPANKRTFLVVKSADDDVSKAQWDAAFINDLPDSSFAVISTGGKKDGDGKTVPRSLRHFPYKNAAGKVDLPHLRNALSRLPQSTMSAADKAKAKSKLDAAAKEAGVGKMEVEKKREVKQEGKKFVLYEGDTKLGSYDSQEKADFAAKNLSKSVYISSSKQVSVREENGKFEAYGGDDNHSLGQFDTMAAAISAATDFLAKTKGGSTMLTKEQLAKIGDEEIQQAVIDQQNEILDLKAKVEEFGKKKEPEPEGDVPEMMWKNVNPRIRNEFQAMKKREELANKKADDERRERRTNEWVSKCAELKFLPNTIPSVLAKTMVALEEKCPDEMGEVFKVLQAANDVVAQGEIFKEIGRTNGSGLLVDGDATSASARIDALAKDMVRRDPNMSLNDAIAKVSNENPDLYEMSKRASQGRA